jgi:hypothetical protein
MKKLTLIAILSILAVMGLYAHPANNVKAQYDAKTAILTVEYGHKVASVSEHYIFNIVVELNGKKMIEQDLAQQESLEGGSLVYKLANLTKGDKVKVTADCSKGGKKSTTLTIP